MEGFLFHVMSREYIKLLVLEKIKRDVKTNHFAIISSVLFFSAFCSKLVIKKYVPPACIVA